MEMVENASANGNSHRIMPKELRQGVSDYDCVYEPSVQMAAPAHESDQSDLCEKNESVHENENVRRDGDVHP